MEKKIKEIIRQVGDIGEKVSLLNADDTLSSIELDIILGDIRILYETIKDLQSGAGILPGKETAVPAGSPPEERPAGAGRKKQESPVDPAAVEQTVTPGAGGVQQATVADEAVKQSATIEKPRKPSQAGKATEPAILADKYKSEKKFINESLAGTGKDQNISGKIQSKPIRNIGSALGINDRFKLIKELFNGDKESFQNTIGILDGASNFNEAFNYISSSFDWDMEEDSVQMLLDLVRRKFIVNQNE